MAEQVMHPSPGPLGEGALMSLSSGVLGYVSVFLRFPEYLPVIFYGGVAIAASQPWLDSVGRVSMSSVAGMS